MKFFLPISLFAAGLLGNAAALDVIFQIDESGSMGNDQAAVQANAISMFSTMQASTGGAFRAGVVGYGSAANSGRPRVVTPLTSNVATFSAGVGSLVTSGYLEPGLLTITETAQDNIAGASGAMLINGPYCGIIITDERSNPSSIDVDTSTAINALNARNAVQFAIDLNFPRYTTVVTATGGARFDLGTFRSNPSTVLNSVLRNCQRVVPTLPPTSAPTPPPTSPPTYVRGDPHFKTWSMEKYDFHGVCDLVLLQNPGFHNNLGLDVHIRTTQSRAWSYVSSAVVRIGEETLEVKGGTKQNEYWVNSVQGDEAVNSSVLTQSIAGYPIAFSQKNEKSREFTIDLGNGSAIVIGTWNAFVSVQVNGSRSADFEHSLGLLGTYGKGEKMARDGVTVIDDNNVFGQEWQVLANEAKLFHNLEGPQAPEKCEIPTTSQMRRRLRESMVSREDAELACSRVSVEDFDLCVFDVLATNDKEAAGAY